MMSYPINSSLNRLIIGALLLTGLLLSHTASAASVHEKKEQAFGDYVVHYNAFNSTVLLPDVAKAYDFERSKTLGLINISVLKNGKPVKAEIKVQSANLLGQRRTLNYRLIDEGDAIYYMAEFTFTNDELLHFTLRVTPENSRMTETIKFTQTFYAQ